jgi:hypothetical protein
MKRKNNIEKELMGFIKDYIIDILDENRYEYYLDQVSLFVDPTTIKILVRAHKCPQILKTFLTINVGLSLIKTDKTKKYLLYSLSYKDMLIIEVTDDKTTFDRIRKEGHLMESVSLKNVVRDLLEKGHTTLSVKEILTTMAKIK